MCDLGTRPETTGFNLFKAVDLVNSYEGLLLVLMSSSRAHAGGTILSISSLQPSLRSMLRIVEVYNRATYETRPLAF